MGIHALSSYLVSIALCVGVKQCVSLCGSGVTGLIIVRDVICMPINV